jgi:hypothetical protein
MRSGVTDARASRPAPGRSGGWMRRSVRGCVGCGDFEQTLGQHWIVPAVAPRVAPEQPPHGEHQAPRRPKLPDRLQRIARTRRLVPAAPRKPGRNHPLIDDDRGREQRAGQAPRGRGRKAAHAGRPSRSMDPLELLSTGPCSAAWRDACSPAPTDPRSPAPPDPCSPLPTDPSSPSGAPLGKAPSDSDPTRGRLRAPAASLRSPERSKSSPSAAPTPCRPSRSASSRASGRATTTTS